MTTAIATPAPTRGRALDRTPTSIPCVAWGPTATAIAEHTDKGHLVAIEGRLTSGRYTNDAGDTVYTMDVAVARCDFLARPKGTTATPDDIDPDTQDDDESEAA